MDRKKVKIQAKIYCHSNLRFCFHFCVYARSIHSRLSDRTNRVLLEEPERCPQRSPDQEHSLRPLPSPETEGNYDRYRGTQSEREKERDTGLDDY